jgi:hypothetical protein
MAGNKEEIEFPINVFFFPSIFQCTLYANVFNQQLIIHQSTNFSSLFRKEKKGREEGENEGTILNQLFIRERSRMRR